MKGGENVARPRKPIAMHSKHYTKEEREQRESEELDVPIAESVEPPDYLTESQKEVFNEYAEQLLDLKIFTNLDVDVLAQYCIARELYIEYSKQIRKISAKENYVDRRTRPFIGRGIRKRWWRYWRA
jgi:phage terminase small subunit